MLSKERFMSSFIYSSKKKARDFTKNYAFLAFLRKKWKAFSL